MKNNWKVLSKTDVYENDWIKVEHNDVTTPSGKQGVYGVVRPKNLAIAVMVLDDKMNCWIVGQYRFATDSYEWELPKGGCPIGSESPLDAGKRELKEETGITALNWQRVLSSNLSNCFSDEASFSYLATGLIFGESEPDENEKFELRKIPLEELVEMCLDGGVKCALSQATVFAVKLMIDKNQI